MTERGNRWRDRRPLKEEKEERNARDEDEKKADDTKILKRGPGFLARFSMAPLAFLRDDETSMIILIVIMLSLSRNLHLVAFIFNHGRDLSFLDDKLALFSSRFHPEELRCLIVLFLSCFSSEAHGACLYATFSTSPFFDGKGFHS